MNREKIPFEKVENTKVNIESLIAKVKQEMKYLEVEWFNLKGLVNYKNNVKDTKIDQSQEVATTVYDDTELINANEFNLKPNESIAKMVKGEFLGGANAESDEELKFLNEIDN